MNPRMGSLNRALPPWYGTWTASVAVALFRQPTVAGGSDATAPVAVTAVAARAATSTTMSLFKRITPLFFAAWTRRNVRRAANSPLIPAHGERSDRTIERGRL